MNKVMLMGRLTKDPELRTATTGNNVCRFTLAVDRSFKKEGEEKQTDFISCVSFGKTAENFSRFFTKGRLCVISGRIQTGNYEKDGQKVYTTDVICDEFFFADSKKDSESASNSMDNTSNSTQGFFPTDNGEDELPF